MQLRPPLYFSQSLSAGTGSTPNPRLSTEDRGAIIKLASDYLRVTLGTSRPTRDVVLMELEERGSDKYRTLLNYLLDHPDEINSSFGNWASPGHYALLNNANGLYKVLNRFPKFNMALQDGQGNTHLHLAGCLLNEEIISYILLPLRDPILKTIPNKDGETPLAYVRSWANNSDPDRRQRVMQSLKP